MCQHFSCLKVRELVWAAPLLLQEPFMRYALIFAPHYLDFKGLKIKGINPASVSYTWNYFFPWVLLVCWTRTRHAALDTTSSPETGLHKLLKAKSLKHRPPLVEKNGSVATCRADDPGGRCLSHLLHSLWIPQRLQWLTQITSAPHNKKVW